MTTVTSARTTRARKSAIRAMCGFFRVRGIFIEAGAHQRVNVCFCGHYNSSWRSRGDPKSATFGLMHCSKTTPSFDHHVVETEQCSRRETDINTDQRCYCFCRFAELSFAQGKCG